VNKTGWIALVIVGTCVGLVVGAMVRTPRKPDSQVREPPASAQDERRESGGNRVLVASLEKYRKALAEREKEVGELQAELAEVKAKLPPPLSPEEEEKKKEEEELRGWYERSRSRRESSAELRGKILQRRDRVLRAEALDEVAALLQSEDREELMLGLAVLSGLGRVNFDRERFKPAIQAAMEHQDNEVWWSAMLCAHSIIPRTERIQSSASMAKDPVSAIRWLAAEDLGWGFGWRPEQKEAVVSALRSLLKDPHYGVRWQAMNGLSQIPELADEVDDMAIEMSRSREQATRMMDWLSDRETISGKVARRLVEMCDEGQKSDRYGEPFYPVGWIYHQLSDDAKPMAIDLCFRILRDSISFDERSQAGRGLGRIGDVSVLPRLEEIARGDDAEGIEGELQEAITQVRRRANQPR